MSVSYAFQVQTLCHDSVWQNLVRRSNLHELRSAVSWHEDLPSAGLMDSIDKAIQEKDLPFSEFMEMALYSPGSGYYNKRENPIGPAGDFITAPRLSPAYAYSFRCLADFYAGRMGDGLSTIVDVGCGDGSLIRAIAASAGSPRERVRFFGVDRSMTRLVRDPDDRVQFVHDLDEIPTDSSALILSNELYDAFPFARLVQRGLQLNELVVTKKGGTLDWAERRAPAEYVHYFEKHGVRLIDGQFADISLQWRAHHERLCSMFERALLVTIDYGFTSGKLFDPRIRRYGTAGAFTKHQVHRDLLASPGEQDLTAHVNFDDLVDAGEAYGFETLAFVRQARFLLALGITDHPDLVPLDPDSFDNLSTAVERLDEREAARRLVLPDGIGEEMRVLVQSKGMGSDPWDFMTGLAGQGFDPLRDLECALRRTPIRGR